jgi:hypothetical protein
MWDSMEAMVNGLAMTMNKIKELFLMTKGGIGLSARNQMFTTTTVEGANTVRDGTKALKDIAMTFVPMLANITPTLQAPMIQYNDPIASQSAVDDVTLNGHTSSQYGALGEAIESKPLLEEETGVINMEIGHPIAIPKGEHVEVATYALPIVEFGHRDEDSNLTNMDAEYGSEDLRMHDNKKGSPCGETKRTSNVFKGIVQYSDLGEEGGISDI